MTISCIRYIPNIEAAAVSAHENSLYHYIIISSESESPKLFLLLFLLLLNMK
jgi:hypothetical protein